MTNSASINNKELIEKIGKRISVLRKSRGLSGEGLASKIGISHQQLFKYEVGENRITVDRLVAIAEALNFKLSDFFPSSDFGKKVDTSSVSAATKKANFSKFKKLSGEEIISRFVKLLLTN